LRDVLDALPVAVYATDTEGRITFFNQAAVHFAGRTPDPDTDRWCVSWRLRTSDGQELPIDQSSMALAVKENRPIRGMESVAERPDGTLVPFAPLPTPIRDADDKLVGAVNVLVDLTAEHEAQKQEVTDDLSIHGGLGEALRMLQNLTGDADGGADLLSSFGDLYEHYIATMRYSTDDSSYNGPYVPLDLKIFLKQIFTSVLGANASRVQTWGSAAHLQPKAALILGMIILELAKYSARAGAIAVAGGFVGLAWKVQALPNQNGRLTMDWQEYGGRQGRELPESSLVVRLIKFGVIEALRGEAKITYDAPGTRCRLEITI
jgi:PAS domain S-box-containing protein